MVKDILEKPESFYEIFERKSGSNKLTTHYCPGCGHGVIHKLIAEAMDEFGIGDRAVMISPVGCSVFAYYYFDCGNVQAPHGRAPAVATGIKRAIPDSIVISYQGDGDLAGIGGNEILHAANRGENITVFFVNNAIYGMTGSQMAPTTLIGQKTTTTPYGRSARNEGYPIKVCELLSSLEAPVYLERVAITDAKNVMKVRKAIRKGLQNQIEGKGFSLIEILSPCPTGWGMKPVDAKNWVDEVLMKTFQLGVFKDKTAEAAPEIIEQKEFTSDEILKILGASKNGSDFLYDKPEVKINYQNPRIKISGFGGQGILFLGQLLSQSAMRSGYYTTWLPSYGPEVRGGTANCHIIISNNRIGSPLGAETDVLIAMNLPSLDKFENDVRKDGLILVNSSLISRNVKRNDVEVLYVPATELADEVGNTKVANLVMLGAYTAKSKIFSHDCVLFTANETVKKKEFLKVNEEAFRKGMEYVLNNKHKKIKNTIL
ncbi:MAG: 2-oxoacid:acceptor oxidoreductase family protein [Ignavibacteria bacterium]|nr:2-oxoacid:acceptor oxidoreductase family protein [Ignavibacteria bacterium]